MYDFIIVGAGFAGSVLAERIANRLRKRVLILERRAHIGGNCYDEIDSQSGVLVHRYGPHLFHTDNAEVFDYLSRFCQWRAYEHRVLARVDGQEVSIPFNFHTLHQLYDKYLARKLERKLLQTYGEGKKVPVLELMENSDESLRTLGEYIYEKIFVNYTAKQWGKKPEEIDPAVTARVPVVTAYEKRYFTDRFQAVPEEGYTKLFERMLDSENIEIRLGTESNELLCIEDERISFDGKPYGGKVIFTGEIDALFGYRYGELAYRSLHLLFQTLPKSYFQQASVVNYPNEHSFTRITEFKHIHPSKSEKTTILKEFPIPYARGENLPFYPLFTDTNKDTYFRYKSLADRVKNLYTIGRLAEFRYYDMDDIVARALKLFESEFAK